MKIKKLLILLIIALFILPSLVFGADITMNIKYDKTPLTESSGDCIFDINNLSPGDKYKKTITINNTGDTDLKVYLERVIGSTDAALLSQLKLEILSENGTVLFYNDFNNIDYVLLDTLEKKTTKTFTITFEFNLSAGNDYQGLDIHELLIFTSKTTDFEPPRLTPTPTSSPTLNPVSSPKPSPVPTSTDNPVENSTEGTTSSGEGNENRESDSSSANYIEIIRNNQNIDNIKNYETGVAGEMDQSLINEVINCCNCNCWWWHLITVILLVIILSVIIFKKNDKKESNDKDKKDEN